MMRNTGIYVFILLVLAMIGMVGIAESADGGPKIVTGKTWDWQLSEPYDLKQAVEIFDLEPDDLDSANIEMLKSRNIATICYVSVGTLENWRSDVGNFPASVIGKTYGDWPDEKFLDIRQIKTLLPLMKARFQRCAKLGFDAIEPDNMDVFDNDSGFDISVEDSIKYFNALAHEAHQMGLEIGQKNVSGLSKRLSGVFDFVISESCYQDNFCDAFSPYLAQGKAVLDAEYNDRPIDFKKACTFAAKNKISMILKDRDLTKQYKSCP